MPRPIPEAAPVTITACPSKFIIISSSSHPWHTDPNRSCSSCRPPQSGDPLEGVGVRSTPSVFALVEGIDGRDLLSGKFEVEHIAVFLHPLATTRLRDHDVAMLDVPAKDDLR